MRSTKWTNKWWGEYQAILLSIQALFSIIANRVGAESYENFSDDNMLNFKYEGTIRRQSGDLLRAVFFHVYLISESQCDTLIMNLKPKKSKWYHEISEPRIPFLPCFRSIISTRIQLPTGRITKPSSKSCCWFRVVFKFNCFLIGSHAHQSEQFENC